MSPRANHGPKPAALARTLVGLVSTAVLSLPAVPAYAAPSDAAASQKQQGSASSTPADEATPAGLSSDTLLLALRGDYLEDGTEGGSLEATWLRARSGRTVGFGLRGFSLGGSEWVTGKLSLLEPVGDRVRLSGELEIGPGDGPTGSFTYRRAFAGISFAAKPRFWLHLRDSFYDIDQSTGNVLQLGLTWVTRSRLSLDARYNRSLAGDDEVNLLTLRIDQLREGPDLIAGVAVGEVAGVLIDLPDSAGTSTDYTQIFAGMRLGDSGTLLDVVFEYQTSNSFDRLAATLLLRLPLGRTPHRGAGG